MQAAKDNVEKFRETDQLLVTRTVEFLKKRAANTDGKPFFLYCCPTAPHDPYLPRAEWKGKSKAGDFGDVVLQLDAHLGEIIRALDESGLGKETLLIVTSDNGPESVRRDYTKTPVRKDGIFANHSVNSVCVRRGDWVLITTLEKKEPDGLYNLRDDPKQETNLADKNAKLVDELHSLLDKERKR